MPDVVIEVVEEPTRVVDVVSNSTTVVSVPAAENTVVEVAEEQIQVVDVIQYPVQVVEVPHTTGPKGAPGIPGADGVSIVGAEVDSEGNLIFTTSEGETIEAGNVTGASGYIHHQGVSVTQWDITHDLGFTPNITVVDSAGTVVEGEIIYFTDSTISVSFTYPFSGKAYLS